MEAEKRDIVIGPNVHLSISIVSADRMAGNFEYRYTIPLRPFSSSDHAGPSTAHMDRNNHFGQATIELAFTSFACSASGQIVNDAASMSTKSTCAP